MNLDKIVDAVKLGVAEAGGVPVVFPAIAVCDGIAMGHIGMKYSLVTRDLIADSTECMALAHQFDALVMRRTVIKMSGAFDGGGTDQCADCICVGRPDARGACAGAEAKPLLDV